MMERFVGIETSQATKAANGDLAFDLALASETPVERFFGKEILDASPKSVRLGRLNDGASVLFNHHTDDVRGSHAPGSARVDKDRVVRATVHITSGTQAGRDAIALIEGKHLTKASVGYKIHRLVEETKRGGSREIDGATFERIVKRSADEFGSDRAAFQRALDAHAGKFERDLDEIPTYRVIDWEPFETSLTPVPADATVGIGRTEEVQIVMTDNELSVTRTVAQQPAKEQQMDQQSVTPGGSAAPDIQQKGPDAATKDERFRVTCIQKMARDSEVDGDQVERWIDNGTSTEEVRDYCLKLLQERRRNDIKKSPANAGMTAKDVQQYSITRAIKACVEKSWPKVAPYEAELSNQVARNLGRQSGEHTFFVPLEAQWAASMQRDQVVATASSGGYLVGTNVVSFIELLRNRSVVMSLGATTMPGLVGSVAIPKQLTAATAYWFATEAGTATESNLTFGQLALSPKTVGGYVEISRQLLLQSTPNAEGIVNNDLARVIALAVDAAALAGPGTAGQPTGITATTGVGTANPGTGTAVSYADIIKFQTTVAGANAFLPGFGYVTTPTVAGIYMAKPRFTNSDTPIWQGNILDGQLVGARAMTSLQVGSGTMIAGDFSQVVIGEWGVLEIETNPYAQFQAGIVGVRALYSVDIGIRYGAAFAMGSGFVS